MGYDIEIDSREKVSRIEKAKIYYKSQLDRVKVNNLVSGDFIFNNSVVFEYKTLVDFVKSVKNGRIYKQAFNQSHKFKYHFVVVVSTLKEREDYFNKLKHSGQKHLYFDDRYFYEAIANLNTFTTVLQVPNEILAFQVMRQQAKRCLDNNTFKNLSFNTQNPVFNWLINVNYVGRNQAQSIVDCLDLSCLDDLCMLDFDDLIDCGINDDTADIIIKSIRRKNVSNMF